MGHKSCAPFLAPVFASWTDAMASPRGTAHDTHIIWSLLGSGNPGFPPEATSVSFITFVATGRLLLDLKELAKNV